MARSIFETYAGSSLGSCGFAVLDRRVAARQRPDLWADATYIDGLSENAKASMRAWPGVRRFRANIAELGSVEVLARTDQDLIARIYWAVGLRVLELKALGDERPPAARDLAPAARPAAPSPAGDRYAGVTTVEAPRSCSACDRYTAGHTCSASAESGIEHPQPRVMRRCRGFKPQWDAHDPREASKLWPEIFAISLDETEASLASSAANHKEFSQGT